MEKENQIAYEKAMEALKKQLGKIPDFNNGYYACGNCGAIVGIITVEGKIPSNYCMECGYRVNWEEL